MVRSWARQFIWFQEINVSIKHAQNTWISSILEMLPYVMHMLLFFGSILAMLNNHKECMSTSKDEKTVLKIHINVSCVPDKAAFC